MPNSKDGREYLPRGRSRSCSNDRTYRRDNSDRPRDTSRQRHKELKSSHRRHSSRSRSPSRSPPHLSHHRSRSISRSPKRHARSRSRSRDKDSRKRGRSRSRPVSTTPSTSSDHKHRKRKKDKHGKRSNRSRERKERKKEKRKKQNSNTTPQWGKHGLIGESDLFTKGPEFHTWLVEERKINPETISKDQSKKEFARFIEDFNTATLPHEKYYHMEAYERRMSAMRQGEYVPPPDDSYDPAADMRAHQSKHKKKEVEHESYLNKDQLMELRRVQHERIEAGKMKLLGMDVKQNMGVRMDGTMFDG